MPLFIMGFMMILAVAGVGGLRLYLETIQLRREVDELRRKQNELLDMMSNKILEDDSLSREILQLKIGRKPTSQ